MSFFHKSQTDVPLRTFEIKNIISQLQIINSNVLYLTHEIDQIKTIVMKIHNTVNLKQQSLEYYQTSPQTEPDEQ